MSPTTGIDAGTSATTADAGTSFDTPAVVVLAADEQFYNTSAGAS